MGEFVVGDIVCHGILSYQWVILFWHAYSHALATGLPVMLVAWILAYSIARIGKFYDRVQTLQKWFNYIVAILFIWAGIYYGLINLGII